MHDSCVCACVRVCAPASQFTGGRAFTSYLHEAPPPGSTQHFILHLHFGNQAFTHLRHRVCVCVYA